MHWGHALNNLAKNFFGQEDAGIGGALLLRAARYMGGDPAGPVAVTSTGVANTQGLPDLPAAQSAQLQVQTSAIIYRVDGLDPAAYGGAMVTAGSYITLTGQPTMRAFRFVSAVAANASVAGTYFD
ncbi:MAG TPA: hypothetical protein VIX86_19200 [Streptosporangiaceae bacterium]